MGARNPILSLVACLLASSLAAAEGFNAAQKVIDIPADIARVTDASLSNNRLPEFILIQDIHRHPEAQANIAALLMHTYLHNGVRTVFLEGAYVGQTIARESEELLRTKLYEGTISGAEMASSMIKAGELRLKGMEEPEVYKDNVKAYQSARDQESQALQEIRTARLVQETLDLGAERRLSPDQLNRLELLARLKLKPAEFASYLKERAETVEPPGLSKSLEAAERFYQLAEQRSSIFVNQALGNSISGSKAFVVGGFHTGDMAQALRAAGKTFVVLSPHVTRSGYEHLYAERMNETINALKLR